jgi:hypothetical protein
MPGKSLRLPAANACHAAACDRTRSYKNSGAQSAPFGEAADNGHLS